MSLNADNQDFNMIVCNSTGTNILAAGRNTFLYKSQDGGNSWIRLTSARSRFWVSISMSDNGQKILAATKTEVFYSSNGGSTWNKSYSTDLSNIIADVSISPNGFHGAIALYSIGGKVYTTTNFSTWTQDTSFNLRPTCIKILNDGSVLDNNGIRLINNRIIFNISYPIYSTCSENLEVILVRNGLGRNYISYDKGETFILSNTNNSLSFSKTSPDGKIIAFFSVSNSRTTVKISFDKGLTFKDIILYNMNAVFDKALARDKMMAMSNNSNFYIQKNYTSSPVNYLGKNIIDRQSSTINADPAFRTEVIGSFSSISCSKTNSGNNIAISTTDGFIKVSNDYGQTWRNVGDKKDWTKVKISNNGNILIASTSSNEIWRSLNAGSTWTKIYNTVFTNFECSDDCVHILIYRLNSTLYASHNSGDNFSLVTLPSGGTIGTIRPTNVALSSAGDFVVVSVRDIQSTAKHGYITSSDYGFTWNSDFLLGSSIYQLYQAPEYIFLSSTGEKIKFVSFIRNDTTGMASYRISSRSNFGGSSIPDETKSFRRPEVLVSHGENFTNLSSASLEPLPENETPKLGVSFADTDSLEYVYVVTEENYVYKNNNLCEINPDTPNPEPPSPPSLDPPIQLDISYIGKTHSIFNPNITEFIPDTDLGVSSVYFSTVAPDPYYYSPQFEISYSPVNEQNWTTAIYRSDSTNGFYTDIPNGTYNFRVRYFVNGIPSAYFYKNNISIIPPPPPADFRIVSAIRNTTDNGWLVTFAWRAPYFSLSTNYSIADVDYYRLYAYQLNNENKTYITLSPYESNNKLSKDTTTITLNFSDTYLSLEDISSNEIYFELIARYKKNLFLNIPETCHSEAQTSAEFLSVAPPFLPALTSTATRITNINHTIALSWEYSDIFDSEKYSSPFVTQNGLVIGKNGYYTESSPSQGQITLLTQQNLEISCYDTRNNELIYFVESPLIFKNDTAYSFPLNLDFTFGTSLAVRIDVRVKYYNGNNSTTYSNIQTTFCTLTAIYQV